MGANKDDASKEGKQGNSGYNINDIASNLNK